MAARYLYRLVYKGKKIQCTGQIMKARVYESPLDVVLIRDLYYAYEQGYSCEVIVITLVQQNDKCNEVKVVNLN